MYTCHRCKAKYSYDTKVCTQCGAGDPPLYCGICGKELDLRYGFCNSCGRQYIVPPQYINQSNGKVVKYKDKAEKKREAKKKISLIAGIVLGTFLMGISVIDGTRSLAKKLDDQDRQAFSIPTPLVPRTETPPQTSDTNGYRKFYANGERLFYSLEDIYLENLTKSKMTDREAYRSYEITEMAEKHDSYKRYIVQVNYKESDGEKWSNKSAYIYARYSDTKKIWLMPINLENAPDKSFMNAIGWEQDRPYEADLSSYASYKKAKDESVPKETVSPLHSGGNAIPYNVYNTYNDGADTLGYFSFSYKGYEFEIGVSKMEEGRKLVEAGYNTADDTLEGSYLDWESYNNYGIILVDNHDTPGNALGSYVGGNPSDLLIIFDTNQDGKADFEIEFNAETNELWAGDSYNSRKVVATIDWQ